jgi:hypothetical protein
MHRSFNTWAVFVCLGSGSLLAASPLRYLDEIGHLGTPSDPRTSVRLGRTQVVLTDAGVRFQGRDDDGKRWQAVLPIAEGIAFTTVWEADFDQNSRPDLLIAAHSAGSGRCLDEVTLSFLLFNSRGQPVPWVIQSRTPFSTQFPPIPAIFADLEGTGRAKLVVTDCAYSDPPRLGEDRSIIGIYEAKDAAWGLVKPVHLDAYTALVRQNHRFRPQLDQLLTVDPGSWADEGNRMGRDVPAPVQLAAVLKPSEDCRGAVHLPPVVNGTLQTSGWKDPCEELGRNRIELSDKTVCYGWPTVMLDGADGREIVAESEHPELLLRKIIDQRRKVILIGQRDPKRCSPVLLWAVRAQ